jgi:hypothetical protein
MRVLSATECITPAVERTKAILFRPFRKGRSWKLAASAYLGRFGTMFFPFPFIYLMFLPAAKSAGTTAVFALVSVVVLMTVVAGIIFYLCSKLQFAFFDIVLNRGEFVAPAWRKYSRQALSWTTAKLAIGTVVTVVAALPIAAYVHHLLPLLEVMKTLKPGEPPPPELIGAIFAGYGVIFLIFGPFFLISSILCDFIVPSLALENNGLSAAFRRMIDLVRREPGEFVIYLLLKLGLGMAAYMGATIAWEIAFFLCTAILGIVVFAIGFLLHMVGIPTAVLMVLGVFIAVVWYLLAFVYGLLLTLGTVLTFFDAYNLYFLNGRYPLLGDLLERSEPAPVAYRPPPGFGPPYPMPPPPSAE